MIRCIRIYFIGIVLQKIFNQESRVVCNLISYTFKQQSLLITIFFDFVLWKIKIGPLHT